MLPVIYYILFIVKSLLFYGFQAFLLFQMAFAKFFSLSFLKKSSKSIFLKCTSLKSFRKSNKNYITLHISEKIKKKKIRLLNQVTCKRDNIMEQPKRSLQKDRCFGVHFDLFTKKYNDFYNDLPLGFQQLYNSKNKSIDEMSSLPKKIKEPFFGKKAKILSSTDIRLHDYNDLNGVVCNYCLNGKNRYENEYFTEYLLNKYGKKMSFLEVYDMYYRRRCVDRKCGCTRNFLKISSFPLMKKKSLESKCFLAVKLTPILENIEYI